ncbi:MAG: hypothetical protein K0S61_3588 [Anaerocolumna sp.]|jgi:hypothetical protein|nr:hypothetical protein [Anaerocolumna sp.]
MNKMRTFKSFLSYSLTLMIIASAVPAFLVTASASTVNGTEAISPTPTTPIVKEDPILKLNKVDKSDLLNLYKEKTYEVYKTLHNSSSNGIYKMGLKTDGSPVMYDSVTLASSKEKGTKVYAWNGSKWAIQTSYPLNEYGLRVLTWSNGKWNEKVLRYTSVSEKTNPFKSKAPLNIQRDSSDQWYMSVEIDGQYYIYQLDKSLKVKYSANVSSLTSSRYSDFYLLMSGKVLLKTYDYDNSSPDAEWNSKYWIYKPLQLLNLAQGKITREYNTGYDIDGYIQVNGKYVYMRDKSKENIIMLNSYAGNVSKVLALAEYEELVKVHDYSEELGSQYHYDFTISGKYLYLLKKTGVYRIDLGNGKFRELMDGSSKPFTIQDMRFLDFEVKDENNMYILAVFFDERFPSNFYTYTK